MYIYMHAVESNICPRFAFLSQTSVHFSHFSFCSFQNFFCRENEIVQKTKKKTNNYHCLSQKSVQLCCATCFDRFLTQPWPDF